MSQRTRRERVTAWALDILKTYGGPMMAKDICAALWDYEDKEVNTRMAKTKHYDTVSPVQIGMWLKNDDRVKKEDKRDGRRYTWVGDEDG